MRIHRRPTGSCARVHLTTERFVSREFMRDDDVLYDLPRLARKWYT
jgi:hypothetical protein